MFLHLVIEVFRYQQVIVPTVAGKAGFVEGFAHTADFQIGFQRGGDTGNLFVWDTNKARITMSRMATLSSGSLHRQW